MIPTRLEIAGITRFREPLVLDLAGLPDGGVVALVGDNGAGKSTILEALGPAGVYRDMATYPGALLASADPARRDCWIDLTMEHAGHVYRHLHQLDPMAAGGRGKSEATLWRDGVPISERRTGDYDEAIARVYPPRALFMAAAFAAQDGGGDWIGMARKDRRDLFAGFLGLEDLQARAERARERRREAEGQIEVARAQIAMLADADVAALGRKLRAAQAREAEADEARQAARALWGELTERMGAAQARLDAARQAHGEAVARYRQAAAQRDRDVAQVAAWRAERERLAATDLDAIARARDGAAELEAAREALHADITEARDAEHAALTRAGNEDRARHDAVRAADQVVYDARNDLRRATEALADAQSAAELAARVPCRGAVLQGESGAVDCGACELLADALEARDRLRELGAAVQVRAERVEAAESKAREARDRLSAPMMGAAAVEQARERLAMLERTRADLRGRLDALAPLAKQAHLITSIPARLAELDALIADAGARLAVTPPEPPAEHVPDPALLAELAEATAARERCNAWGQAAAGVARSAASDASVAEGAIAAAKRDAARRAELAAKAAALGADASAYALLERGLGRDGLQALEIDRAGPEVSDLLNELLAEVWGPRFRCQLVTTQDAGRGKVAKEVFDLAVLDGGRGGEPRPIERYSHGERSLISEALRLALAIYAARRSPVRIGSLFRDEADRALQADLAERYPAMLRRAMALGDFRRCFLISHREAVWAQADATIRLPDGLITIA